MANATTDPTLPGKSLASIKDEPLTGTSSEDRGEVGIQELTTGKAEGEADVENARRVTGVKVRLFLHISVRLSTANNVLQWFLVVTAILSSHMLFALDNTIVANIQPVRSPLPLFVAPYLQWSRSLSQFSVRQSLRHLTVPVKYLGFL